MWETIIHHLYEPSVEETRDRLFLIFVILIVDRQLWWGTYLLSRCYSVVAPGDTIHVIGEFDSEGKCEIDREKNFLIVHPDILVSGTRVCLCNYFSVVCFDYSTSCLSLFQLLQSLASISWWFFFLHCSWTLSTLLGCFQFQLLKASCAGWEVKIWRVFSCSIDWHIIASDVSGFMNENFLLSMAIGTFIIIV